MLRTKPEEVITRAVYGMTNKSTLANHQMKKLKVYAGTEHPHASQQPTELLASATTIAGIAANYRSVFDTVNKKPVEFRKA